MPADELQQMQEEENFVAIFNSTEMKAESVAEDPKEKMTEEAIRVCAKSVAENPEEAIVSDDAEAEEEHPANEDAANAAPQDTPPNIVSSTPTSVDALLNQLIRLYLSLRDPPHLQQQQECAGNNNL
jgi:hypothetical protein